MNEVLNASLLKKQLPEYVNDTLGNVNFGPSLKTQSDDVVMVGSVAIRIDDLMKRCSDDVEVKLLIADLVDAISKASPRNLYRYKNAGFFGRLWNSLTGGIDSKVIEFNLYCRRVEKLAKYAPELLEQVKESIQLISGLRELYQKDVALLDQYIEAGTAYLNEYRNSDITPTSSLEYGMNRLKRKLVNLKVTKSTLEMHTASVEMSLHASLDNLERMKDCVNGLIPMWQQQVRMFTSGAYDINTDAKTDEKFRALVNKINANTGKGKH